MCLDRSLIICFYESKIIKRIKMISNKIININFRVRKKEGDMLKLLANKYELKLSEILRQIVTQKLKKENLIN